MRGFEIGLVKAREHDVTVIGLQLRIYVFRFVLIVFEVLHALAISNVERLEFDLHAIGSDILERTWDVNTVVEPDIGSVRPDPLTIDYQ